MKEKQALMTRLKAGLIAETLDGLQTAAQQSGQHHLQGEIVGLRARLLHLGEQQAGGDRVPDEFVREQEEISQAVGMLIERLAPGAGVASVTPAVSGITEDKFKEHVLYMLLAAKLIVLLYIYTTWQSGGWTNADFITVLSIILPVFATYLTLILKEIINKRHVDAPADQRIVKRSFRITTYWIMGLYFVAIIQVLSMRVQGVLDAQDMGQLSGLLALIESAMGVYVGQIIFALFKKEDQ